MVRPWTRLASTARLGVGLFEAFGSPYTLQDAGVLMHERIKQRAESFLSLLRTTVYSIPASPYRWLLETAGYPWERVRTLVRAGGLERTLAELATSGVYLDINEFKGKKPVIRDGRTLNFADADVDLVHGASLLVESSGSHGRPLASFFGINALRLQASFLPLVVDVLRSIHLPVVLYYPFATGLVHLIAFTLAGLPPAAWFSQLPVKQVWHSGPDRQLLIARLAALLRSIHLPPRRFADIQHPASLASWLHRHCPHGALIGTFPGSAVRLLRAARDEAVQLPPLTFLLGGEPVSDRKRAFLEEASHRVFPWYSSVETGRIALGCARPRLSDDMHVLVDRIAIVVKSGSLVTPRTDQGSLLITTLSPSAHKFLLNVETGDRGTLDESPCGCPWEKLGLRLHLHTVRSFEKLTPEGMTFMADTLGDLVETALPTQFGGSAADYQFAEEEVGPNGLTRLVLFVDPAIAADERRLYQATMDAIRADPDGDGMVELLNRADTLTIRREMPRPVSGKLLPVRFGPPEMKSP